MPSSHLILCRPLLLLPPIPPSIRVFSNESTLRMRWPKYWSYTKLNKPATKGKTLWKVAQLCLLCEPIMVYTVHGIFQIRILEWVAYPFSSGSSLPRNQTGLSCIAGRFFTNWAIRKAPKILYQSTYMRYLESSNPQQQRTEQWCPGAVGRRGWGVSVQWGQSCSFARWKSSRAERWCQLDNHVNDPSGYAHCTLKWLRW